MVVSSELLASVQASERRVIPTLTELNNFYSLTNVPGFGVRVDDKTSERIPDGELEVLEALSNLAPIPRTVNPLTDNSILIPFYWRKVPQLGEQDYTELYMVQGSHTVHDIGQRRSVKEGDDLLFIQTVEAYLQAITKALDFLHSNGIAHRDVYPGNVIYVEGKAHLMDFSRSTHDLNQNYRFKCGVDIDRTYVAIETQGFINAFYRLEEDKRAIICKAVFEVGEDFARNSLPIQSYFENTMEVVTSIINRTS